MSLHRMEQKILEENRALSGDEMLPHWAYRNFGLLGDSIVAFQGPFKVPPDKWLDLESVMHGRELPASDMLHFIVEHFDSTLSETVLRQHLLVSILEEKLLHRIPNICRLTRLGDDLFDGENRLSITAAGSTLVSNKIHMGLYLKEQPAEDIRGLAAYDIEPMELAEVVISQYRAEMRRLCEKSWRLRPIV